MEFVLLSAFVLCGTEPAWGPATDGLSMGIAVEGTAGERVLRVSFKNEGLTEAAFVAGGSAGGDMFSFDIETTSQDGAVCKLMDFTVGSVAGYIAPIVIRLSPGGRKSVTIATSKLFCAPGVVTTPLERLLMQGHSLRVTFTATEDSNRWGRVTPGWTGKLASGRFNGR